MGIISNIKTSIRNVAESIKRKKDPSSVLGSKEYYDKYSDSGYKAVTPEEKARGSSGYVVEDVNKRTSRPRPDSNLKDSSEAVVLEGSSVRKVSSKSDLLNIKQTKISSVADSFGDKEDKSQEELRKIEKTKAELLKSGRERSITGRDVRTGERVDLTRTESGSRAIVEVRRTKEGQPTKIEYKEYGTDKGGGSGRLLRVLAGEEVVEKPVEVKVDDKNVIDLVTSKPRGTYTKAPSFKEQYKEATKDRLISGTFDFLSGKAQTLYQKAVERNIFTGEATGNIATESELKLVGGITRTAPYFNPLGDIVLVGEGAENVFRGETVKEKLIGGGEVLLGGLGVTSRVISKVKSAKEVKLLEEATPEISIGLSKRGEEGSKVLVASKRETPNIKVETIQSFNIKDGVIKGGEAASKVYRDAEQIAQKELTFFGESSKAKNAIKQTRNIEEGFTLLTPSKEGVKPSYARISYLTKEGEGSRSVVGGLVLPEERAGESYLKFISGKLKGGIKRTGKDIELRNILYPETISSPEYKMTGRFKPLSGGVIKEIKIVEDVGTGRTIKALDTKQTKNVLETLETERKLLEGIKIPKENIPNIRLTGKTEQISEMKQSPKGLEMFKVDTMPELAKDVKKETSVKSFELLKEIAKKPKKSEDVLSVSKQDTKVTQDIKSKVKSLFAEQQRQRSKTAQEKAQELLSFKSKLNINVPSGKIPVPIIIKKPSAVDTVKEMAKGIKDEFSVFVKRGGKDIEILKASTKEEAVKSLASRLKGTLRASGFIEQDGRRLKVEELGLIGSEFRPSKVDPFRVVQRRSQRLGTKSETKELQFFRSNTNLIGGIKKGRSKNGFRLL